MKYSKFKDNRAFTLCSVALLGSLALGFVKDLDVNLLIPAILGIYITGRTTEKVSAHYNARQDVDADVEKIVAMTNGVDSPE